MTTTPTGTSSRSSPRRPAKDITASYDAMKECEGERYTGMKIGRSHKSHRART